MGLGDRTAATSTPACHHVSVSALSAAGQVSLLLVPFAVMGLVFVVVPIVLTRRNEWSAASGLLAVLAAVTFAAFVIVSAQQADANPSGSAEGAMGTDVPGLLLPPSLFGVLALIAGRRWSPLARECGSLDPPNDAGISEDPA